MIDVLEAEGRITFRELAERLPRDARGNKVSLKMLKRYAQDGRRGVYLPAARVGGQWWTTESAANAFFAARPAPAPAVVGAPTPPSKAEARYQANVRRRLAKIGLV